VKHLSVGENYFLFFIFWSVFTTKGKNCTKISYVGFLSAFPGIEAALEFEVLQIDSGFTFRF